MILAANPSDNAAATGEAIFFAVGAVVLYFVPSIVAWSRRVNRAPVTVVNVFLGWTFIGWIVALVMALREVPPPWPGPYWSPPPWPGPPPAHGKAEGPRRLRPGAQTGGKGR